MAYDPLSSATRRTRKVLLIFASSLLFVTIFKIKVNSVPMAGVVVGIEDGLIKTVLLLLTVYNLIYFALYVFDDITYLKKPDSLSKDNTDIRNQLTNLDQFVFEASAQREAREASVYYSAEVAKKNDQTLRRLREIRQEVYDRITKPQKELTKFSKFRIYLAEAMVPLLLGAVSSLAALQPALPEFLRFEIIQDVIGYIRNLSIEIGSNGIH